MAKIAGSYGVGSKTAATETNDNSAVATSGGIAYAGSEDTETTADGNSAVAAGGIAYAGSEDTGITADDNSAFAEGVGSTALAGSNDSATSGAASDNLAIARGAGTTASAGNNGSGGEWQHGYGDRHRFWQHGERVSWFGLTSSTSPPVEVRVATPTGYASRDSAEQARRARARAASGQPQEFGGSWSVTVMVSPTLVSALTSSVIAPISQSSK